MPTIQPGRPSLLSAQALRLLDLLTPDFTPIGAHILHEAVRELENAGLAETRPYSGTIRLTASGRAWRPSMNN